MKPFIWPYLFYDLVKPNVKWNLLKLHFEIPNFTAFAFSSRFCAQLVFSGPSSSSIILKLSSFKTIFSLQKNGPGLAGSNREI